MKLKSHLLFTVKADSRVQNEVQNEVNGNEIGPDKTHLSHPCERGTESLYDVICTEETQIVEVEIDGDGMLDDTQATSQNQTDFPGTMTISQMQSDDNTQSQMKSTSTFPDPAVDDSDLQRFEPMMDIIDKMAIGEKMTPQITMRYEMLRFCTLRSFPKENKPFITRIAQAGFYYANMVDEVVCYCCAKRKCDWRETDVPLEVHRQLSPNCRFLVSNSEVNISVKRQEILASRRSVPSAGVTRSADDSQINAKAASSVSAPASPSAVSQSYSSSTTSLISSVNTINTIPAQYTIQASAVRNPKYPAYVTLTTRQASFRDCSELAVPADILAEAGFFYAGFDDCCRCFQCGVGLRHWSAEDDPWIEHSRWSRNCLYVREKKGEEFINLVQMAIEYQQNQELSREQEHSSEAKSANAVRIPKYPAYVTLATRQASFRDCSELAVPADSLAEAGFFYAGYSDCCRCFQCGVGLKDWSPEDDPWIEHSRWSKTCSYVREKIGEEIINLIQMAIQNQEQRHEQEHCTESKSELERFLTELRAAGKSSLNLYHNRYCHNQKTHPPRTAKT